MLARPSRAAAGTDVVTTEPPDVIQAEIVDDITAAPEPEPKTSAKAKKEKRPLLLRLFGGSIWGGFKLLLLCVVIGSGLMLWDETQRATQENAAAAASEAVRQIWAGLVWAVQNFWRPALYGAGVVAPVWVLWRVLTLPFRR